jgi:flagellar motor switch/type III secretory pathway protein FliN
MNNVVEKLQSNVRRDTTLPLPELPLYILRFINLENSVSIKPTSTYIGWCNPFRLRVIIRGQLNEVLLELHLSYSSADISSEWLAGICKAPKQTLDLSTELGGPNLTRLFNDLEAPFFPLSAHFTNPLPTPFYGLCFPQPDMLGVTCTLDSNIATHICGNLPFYRHETVGLCFTPELEILVDQVRISKPQLAGIKAGDALLLGPMADIRAYLRIQGNRPMFWGAISGTTLQIQKEVASMDELDRDNLELDENHLIVEAVLKPQAMSIREVAMLAPGSVVTLSDTVQSAKVQLKVNGQTVAEGTLIGLGDRLAVQIRKTHVIKLK